MATGLLSTAVLPQDLAAKSFSAMLTRLMPNGTAPLFALTALLKEERAVGIEHGYYTKTMIFPSVTLTVAVPDGVATTFTVGSTTDITVGDMLRADTTNEIVIVNTIPSTTSITVTRAVGTVAGAAIGNTVSLFHVGNAFEQGSVRPSAVALVATRYVNFTQIEARLCYFPCARN
jgi:hypothetical protein